MKKRQFIKFYDKYSPDIYRFVYIKLNSVEDSEDITSEAFLQFWKSNQENREKVKNHRALLYKIAKNLVTDFYRKKSNSEIKKEPDAYEFQKIVSKVNLEKDVETDMEMEKVKKALRKLSGEYQNMVIWRYLNELSYKEISYISGKPENSVRVLTHRAMKELKKQF